MNMPSRVPITFAEAVNRFFDECTKVIPTGRIFDTADHDHLQRWLLDHRANALWQKVQSLAFGPIGPFEPLNGFIPLVLIARRAAEFATTNQEYSEHYRVRHAAHLTRAEQLESLAAVWKSMVVGDDPRSQFALKRSQAHKAEAQAWRTLSQKPVPSRPFTVSRVDRNGSRKQRLFMEIIGSLLINLCGRALDSELAVLNDIAFNTEEATTAFQARSARRPTTQPARLNADENPQKNVRRKTK
jgi:hypothetical protein